MSSDKTQFRPYTNLKIQKNFVVYNLLSQKARRDKALFLEKEKAS